MAQPITLPQSRNQPITRSHICTCVCVCVRMRVCMGRGARRGSVGGAAGRESRTALWICSGPGTLAQSCPFYLSHLSAQDRNVAHRGHIKAPLQGGWGGSLEGIQCFCHPEIRQVSYNPFCRQEKFPPPPAPASTAILPSLVTGFNDLKGVGLQRRAEQRVNSCLASLSLSLSSSLSFSPFLPLPPLPHLNRSISPPPSLLSSQSAPSPPPFFTSC